MRSALSTAAVIVVFLIAVLGDAPAISLKAVKEGFEGATIDTIHKAFWVCLRPENEFTIAKEQVRSGKQSLKLTVHKLPLFAHPQPPSDPAVMAATTCMKRLTSAEARQYMNDESERAELREDKSQSPVLGDDTYYGFSMFIDRDSSPEGDFNRIVVAQWKGERNDSPFLSLRLTGGFFHMTLAVVADKKPNARFAPKDCKVLLAFAATRPPNTPDPLRLDYRTQCESRLNYALNQGQPAPPQPALRVERFAFLPNLFGADGRGTWIDLVFHIRAGPNGIVEVWANGELIARATGWIGYHDTDCVGRDRQYFKFGPYRDPAGYSTVVYLDNLARGSSRRDADPSGF